MTIYGVENTYRYGVFRFEVAYDSGSETSLDQRDIHWSQPPDKKTHWVRSFYFDDVNDRYMQNFCRKFAENENYRQDCLEQKTDWAVRDGLFRRNISPGFWQESLVVELLGGDSAAYEFFKKHWKTIVNLEEYQRIQQIDSAFEPSQYEIDPEIREAVEAFNQVPGVETRFSCQGVTKTIPYENLEILADTPHGRLAYISFESVPSSIEPALRAYAPSIAQYKHDHPGKFLMSAGDNVQFRQTALELARSLIHSI